MIINIVGEQVDFSFAAESAGYVFRGAAGFFGVWILGSGFWNDSGAWDDTAEWKDS